MDTVNFTCPVCKNKEHFYWDWSRGEVVCMCCGTVVARILNRWHYEVLDIS